jgi:hypothetical protein
LLGVAFPKYVVAPAIAAATIEGTDADYANITATMY